MFNWSVAGLVALGFAPVPEPKDAVRAVLDAQVAAWNKGDLDSFMAGYWKAPELSFYSGGTVTKGWEATLERYRKRYKADGKEEKEKVSGTSGTVSSLLHKTAVRVNKLFVKNW